MPNYLGVASDQLDVASLNFNGDSFSAIAGIGHTTVTLSPAQVGANTSAEQTFAVTGLKTGDAVSVNKPTAQAGLGIVGCRVSAANTLAITFSNNTAVAIVPTANEVYTISVIR